MVCERNTNQSINELINQSIDQINQSRVLGLSNLSKKEIPARNTGYESVQQVTSVSA